MAEICHLENRHDIIFFSADGGLLWIKFSRPIQNDIDYRICGDVVDIETRCRIAIWRTFGRIQWRVIPEPRITLQSATTWWIHCHDPSRATCHITGCSHLAKLMSWSCRIAGCKNSVLKIVFHHILFFLFLVQFRLWRAAGFVSSPIHLLIQLSP